MTIYCHYAKRRSPEPDPLGPPMQPGLAADTVESYDVLQALFAEVTALANQLRKATASVPRQDSSLAASWGILRFSNAWAPDRSGHSPSSRPFTPEHPSLGQSPPSLRPGRLDPEPGPQALSFWFTSPPRPKALAAIIEREAKSAATLLPCVAESRLVRAATLLRQLRQLLTGHDCRRLNCLADAPLHDASPQPPQGPPGAGEPPPSAKPLPPPEPSEPDETEFPINLL